MTIFSCRSCSENPLTIWQGLWNAASSSNKSAENEKSAKPEKRQSSTSGGLGSRGSSGGASGRRVEFHRRTPEEIKECVRAWQRYAHPRAREFFPTKEMLETVLHHLASGIHRDDDPVLGEDTNCVYWYGDVTKDDQQAAIKMVKPGESQESITYVNRVLAFIFATDESFDQLMRLPKEPFKMSCGDQLCVNLAHISLQVDTCPEAHAPTSTASSTSYPPPPPLVKKPVEQPPVSRNLSTTGGAPVSAASSSTAAGSTGPAAASRSSPAVGAVPSPAAPAPRPSPKAGSTSSTSKEIQQLVEDQYAQYQLQQTAASKSQEADLAAASRLGSGGSGGSTRGGPNGREAAAVPPGSAGGGSATADHLQAANNPNVQRTRTSPVLGASTTTSSPPMNGKVLGSPVLTAGSAVVNGNEQSSHGAPETTAGGPPPGLFPEKEK